MKPLKLIAFFLGILLATTKIAAQANASLNILSLNIGQASVGGIGVVQVTVGNTGPNPILAFKVRAQISVPTAIVNLLTPGTNQTGLPQGWTIQTVNTGSIIVCNGTDVIPAGAQRQIFVKFQGMATGGPSTINGSLLFSNGSSCNVTGTLAGDNTADNTSTTSIQVVPAVACGLSVNAGAGTITCNGGTTTITATPSGGAGTVEYSSNGGAFQPSNSFTVGAGSYVIIAREQANPLCLQTATTVNISQPSLISGSSSTGTIACNGETTSLAITASGGTGALEYRLNSGSFQSSNSFTVGAGSYDVTVRDANLCTVNPGTVIVNEPTVLTAGGTVSTPIPTPGGTGTITVNSGGGTDPKSYAIASGTTTNTTGATTGIFTDLLAGNYTFNVTDGNSCNVTTSSVSLINPGTTPVTLTEFSAALINCQPVLRWATVTEINSDRYEIEKSVYGNSAWTKIGSVTSHGNSTVRQEYNFTDVNNSGTAEKLLYRLKMIDIDGKFKYSEVIVVSVNCRTVQMEVYPNPVRDGKLYVGLTGASGNTEATLVSLTGQVVLKNKIQNGTNYLNVSGVANGVYVLRVKDSKEIDKQIKVQIQN